jgi:hypothetical protein
LTDDRLVNAGFAPEDIAARQAFLNSDSAADIVATFGRDWAESIVRSVMGPPDSLYLLTDIAVSGKSSIRVSVITLIFQEVRAWDGWSSEQQARMEGVLDDWSKLSELVTSQLGSGDNLRLLGLACAGQALSMVNVCQTIHVDPLAEALRIAELIPSERQMFMPQTIGMIRSGRVMDMPWAVSPGQTSARHGSCLGVAGSVVAFLWLSGSIAAHRRNSGQTRRGRAVAK